MTKYILSFFIFFSLSFNSFAQSTWTSYVSMPNDIRSLAIDAQGNVWAGAFGGLLKFDGSGWTTYNMNNSNLSFPDIYSVAIDAQGNKWLGTNGGGLIKFDGTNWNTYATYNSPIPNDYVYSVTIDALGNKWLGNYVGVCKYNGTTWTPYNMGNSGLPSPTVRVTTIDAQGKKWFGTDGSTPFPGGGGVAVYDDVNWSVYNNNNGLANDGIYAITIEASGTKWMGTYGMGLRKFDGTNWTTYNTSNSSLADNHVRAVAVDASGNKWVATAGGGVSKLSGTTWTTYNMANSSLPSNTVNAIVIDALGNKWFATGNGIAKFDGTTWTVYNALNTTLVNNNTKAIAIDASANKWIGTAFGVSKFDGSAWTNYTTGNSGLVDNSVSSIAVDASGNKWIGTEGYGVSKLNGTTWTTYTTSNSGLAGNYILAIVADAQGNKWFGTGSGLSKFDGTTWTNYTTSNSGLSSNIVISIAIDALGNKWIGTDGSGVCKFDGTTWTVYNTTNSGLSDNTVRAIAVDPQGNKWFGTFAGGVNKFDGTTWTVYKTTNSGLANNSITGVGIDGVGMKWFATGTGISKFNGTTWTTYTPVNTNKGLLSNQVYALTIESAGHKWFGTPLGLSKLEELNAPPAITQQPVNISACVLTNVSFSVAANAAINYQWQVFDGITWANVVNNALYSGANTAVLSLSNIPVSVNGYQYRCVIDNAINSVTSTAATLTVNTSLIPAVVISANPGNTICGGTSVTFTATPTNQGTPTYQWKVNGVNAGTNSATFTTTTLTNNAVVTCQMTSSLSCAVPSSATSNGITMTVNPVVVPSVSISANPGNTICAGASTSFTAVPANGGSTPAYQWKVNNVNTGTNSTTYTTNTLNNNDVVTCELTSNATCATPATTPSNSVTMTVNPILTPSVSIAANPGNTICAGASITFTATPTNGGATPSYQWKMNNVNAGTNSSTFTSNTLSNNDIVTCVMTSNAGCLTTATATSSPITIIVNPVLTPSVSIVSGSGATICAGTPVTFTATAINGGTTPSYQWKVNNLNAGTNSNTFNTSTLNNNDAVVCELTSNATCANPTTATSTGITMTVNPLLTPSITIAANPSTPICAGTSVTFSATATNGGTTPSYQWKVNNVNAGTNNTTFTSIGLGNNDVITCQLTSNATCASPASATSTGITMAVNPVLTPGIAISAAPGNTVCAGASVAFTAAATNGGTTPSYQWKVNGVNSGTNSTSFVSTAIANADIVTCELTSNAICLSAPTATSPAINMTVNPLLTPSAVVTANPGVNIGPFVSVTFTANVTNGGTAPTYRWKKNGTNINGATGASYTGVTSKDFISNDVISVAVKSNATCANPTDTISNELKISVNLSVVTLDDQIDLHLIPNPNSGAFRIQGDLPVAMQGRELMVDVLNTIGQRVYNMVIPQVSRKFDINVILPANTPDGMYILQLNDGDKVLNHRFIINRK